MARTVVQIQQQMLDEKASQTALSGLTSTSQTAIWRLFIYVISVGINIFEQLQDLFKNEIETIVTNNYIGSSLWWKTITFNFQYHATIPQVLQINETAMKIAYQTLDTTKRIVTRASIKTDLNRVVNIKVAKSDPPAPLSAPEAASLLGYLTLQRPDGITFNLINATADKLYLAGTIFYDGQYASVIKENVKTALNAYLTDTNNFDGTIKVIDIEVLIRSVTGVSDVQLTDVWIRPDTTPIANSIKMVENSTLMITKSIPYAGYAVEESGAGNTWTDKLIYTVL